MVSSLPQTSKPAVQHEKSILAYGLIGNGQITALVSDTGSINWLCMPAFDSPFVFDRLLDEANGSYFSICPVHPEDYKVEQTYEKNSNILITTYKSARDSFRICDFMPRWEIWEGSQTYAPVELYRYVEVLSGEPEVVVEISCRMNYAPTVSTTSILNHATILFQQDTEKVYLTSNIIPQDILAKNPVRLRAPVFFALSYGEPVHEPSVGQVREKLNRTNQYWQRWIKHCYLPDEYQKEIIRSALALKMLVYEKTGAVIAAPTTSVPEDIGGNRNWDYRFCWIRDTFFTVNALLKLSKFEETERYIAYLSKILMQHPKILRPLYTLDGQDVPPVTTIDHLPGFMDSLPVRIGNDATYHHQIDAYGEAVLTMYPLFMDERVIQEDANLLWGNIEKLVTMAIEKFPEKDNSIWEIGGPPRHYTFSKIMCWAAVDRGCKIASKLGHNTHYRKWSTIRTQMREEILKNAWNERIQAFAQYYGGDELDSSTLLMSLLGIIDEKDPRMLATIERSEELLMVNGMMFRYTHDDEFGVPRNAFTICTFWLIDALILAGQKKKARKYFETILTFGNHLGLYSEHIDPTTRQMTGNFPQGYTHVAIINSAMLLAEK